MKEGDRFIPPQWCRNICLNAGEIACVYDCARERDARFFLPYPDLKLADIAPFPIHNWRINSSPKERQVMAGLYLSKLVEAVTGIPTYPEDESLKKELDGESYARTWEIVQELLDGSNNGEEAGPLKKREGEDNEVPTETRQTVYQANEEKPEK